MNTPRNIHVQLIVQSENPAMSLIEAVAQHFETIGFKATLPHAYPEDPMILEYKEPIPPFTY